MPVLFAPGSACHPPGMTDQPRWRASDLEQRPVLEFPEHGQPSRYIVVINRSTWASVEDTQIWEVTDEYIEHIGENDYSHLPKEGVRQVYNLPTEQSLNGEPPVPTRPYWVEWDTQDDQADEGDPEPDLPEQVDVPAHLHGYDVPDWLSDAYGYCVVDCSPVNTVAAES